MKKTLLFAAVLLLVGCSNSQRFVPPESRPVVVVRPPPHLDASANRVRRHKDPPLMKCKSDACKSECSKAITPKWCLEYEKPE